MLQEQDSFAISVIYPFAIVALHQFITNEFISQ